MKLEPPYRDTGNVTMTGHQVWEPVYPCRIMHTRHCPAVYEAVCGQRPCARFEGDDNDSDLIAAWEAEI